MGPFSKVVLASDKRLAMPILTFPGARLIGAPVRNMVMDASVQCEAQIALQERFRTVALLSAMDLSVEAEAFGAEIYMSDEEVPTVVGRLVTDFEGIKRLDIPSPGDKRSRVYLDTVKRLRQLSNSKLVLGGMIGPFSLAGRLFGLSEVLMLTAAEPESLDLLLEKTSSFLTDYAQAFRSAGAHGVIMAEPSAGLLSPRALPSLSSRHIQRIISQVQDDGFQVILHNCAAKVAHLPGILQSGARALHFGAPMDLPTALGSVGDDLVICGNLDPSGVFCGASAEQMSAHTRQLLESTKTCRNFVISSGCDVPAAAPMANLEAFFVSVNG